MKFVGISHLCSPFYFLAQPLRTRLLSYELIIMHVLTNVVQGYPGLCSRLAYWFTLSIMVDAWPLHILGVYITKIIMIDDWPLCILTRWFTMVESITVGAWPLRIMACRCTLVESITIDVYIRCINLHWPRTSLLMFDLCLSFDAYIRRVSAYIRHVNSRWSRASQLMFDLCISIDDWPLYLG